MGLIKSSNPMETNTMSNCVTAPEIPVKQPSEVRQFTMDFANLLSGVEVISSITSVSDEKRGGDVSDLTVYNEVKTDTMVTFWVSGGTDGVTYHIEVVVVTSASQTLEGDGLLSVRDK